jgi:ferredoxin-NADP reductase
MHTVKILLKETVTHNVKRFIVEKPENYKFTPGQATEVAINQPEWANEKRPFTFTSLNKDNVIEFVIKGYDPATHPDHDGMTHHLHSLQPGDELLIDDPWGTIEYKGPGVFIAAGAGITPFLAIFKQLAEDGKITKNKLLYSNKMHNDIIYEKVLDAYFEPDNLYLTLTKEDCPGYHTGRIDEEVLKKEVKDLKQHMYVCGPPPFLGAIKETLNKLGADVDSVVFEK